MEQPHQDLQVEEAREVLVVVVEVQVVLMQMKL
jgi:hypothetical protein